MGKINVAYFVAFILDKETHESAITIMKAKPDGKLEAIKLIHGVDAEAIYDLIFEDDNA